MRDDYSSVALLVARAAYGDQAAWNEIVERYAPLVWSICTRYRLSSHDIEDVGQSVWLLLVEHLGNLREPTALPGWLATTTQRECQRVLRAARRYDRFGPVPDELPPLPADDTVIEQEIITAERNVALRAAFGELAPRCRELLSMLITDPPLLRGDQRHPADPGREHRSPAGAVPRTAPPLKAAVRVHGRGGYACTRAGLRRVMWVDPGAALT
jgi:RNA polymerase sigma factor (sigma-70 family)